MKDKYFFEKDLYHENCFMLDYWKETAKERSEPITIVGANIIYGDGTFYCSMYGTVGLVDDSDCGSDCASYKPRNYVSGRCIESKNCYERNQNFYKVFPNGKVIKEL